MALEKSLNSFNINEYQSSFLRNFMRDNLVSILMPCFNSQNFIGQSIESVLNQTYQSWELLICDDGSDDGSKYLIQAYEQKDSRIKLVNNKFSKGAPGARNSCLDVAKGQFIAFLDADDLWLPSKLSLQMMKSRQFIDAI